MATELRPTGINVLGAVSWGTHFCCFYETQQDLLDILIPYFKAGLEHNEFCLWVTFAPLMAEDAIQALRQMVPDLDRYLAEHRIELLPHAAWYLRDGVFNLHQVINSWKERLAQALARGYAGMRAVGPTAWLEQKDWKDFSDYEQALDDAIADQRMIVLCAYPLATSGAAEVLDVARTHQFAIARRHGNWDMLETPALKQAKAEIQRLNGQLEQRVAERTSELVAANAALRQEIAERKRAEDDLRTQQEIFQKIFDHIPVMIRFVGADGRIKLVNRAWERTLGWSLDEIQQHNLDIFAEMSPDPQERQRVLKFIAEATGEWADFKTRVRDGRVRDTSWANIRLADGTTIGIGQDITERKQAEAERARLFEQVRASREQLQILSHQLLQAQEAERRAIARELHDEIGQRLTGLGLMLTTSQQLPPDLAHARLAEAQSLVRDLIEQVRNLALDLRPAMLDDLGLVPTLVWLFERYTAQTNLSVRFEHSRLEEQRFVPEVETTAYRIVQEALTNVARHAGAPEVIVRIWADADALSVVIQDQGRGFDPQAIRTRASIGLAGMQERAALLGGELTIESARGAGTRVTVILPLNGGASHGREHGT